jgi:hypothetical protein
VSLVKQSTPVPEGPTFACSQREEAYGQVPGDGRPRPKSWPAALAGGVANWPGRSRNFAGDSAIKSISHAAYGTETPTPCRKSRTTVTR